MPPVELKTGVKEATGRPTKSAPLRSVAAPERSQPVRLAPASTAPAICAPDQEFPPGITARVKSAWVRVGGGVPGTKEVKSQPVKSAPVQSAPEMCRPPRCSPAKIALCKWVPSRTQPLRDLTPRKSHRDRL